MKEPGPEEAGFVQGRAWKMALLVTLDTCFLDHPALLFQDFLVFPTQTDLGTRAIGQKPRAGPPCPRQARQAAAARDFWRVEATD